MTSLLLPPDEAHVWYCRTACADTPLLRARLRSLLCPDETERLERLAFDRLKLEYLVTRALCRTVLSAYVANVPPSLWRFRTNSHGRPEVDEVVGNPPLRFNLSNAQSLVACVVTRNADAGIDVEEKARGAEIEAVADACFSQVEQATLRALPVRRRRAHCVALWTLKECYSKARGLGLALPFDRLSFVLGDGGVAASFDAAVGDDPGDWQFVLLDIDPLHHTALALRHPGRRPLRVRVHETVPCAGMGCVRVFRSRKRAVGFVVAGG